MTVELKDASRRLTNSIGTCWLHAGLKEIELAYFAATHKKMAFSVDYSILQTTRDRFLMQIKGASLIRADLEAGGEVNEARSVAAKYGVYPESLWKNAAVDWRHFANNANNLAAKLKQELKDERPLSQKSLDRVNAQFDKLVSHAAIAVSTSIKVDGKQTTPVELAASFLKEEPKDYILYGVEASTGVITRKGDMGTRQKILMTDWTGIQTAIKATLERHHSILLSTWWEYEHFRIDQGILTVKKPLSDKPEGHVVNIVGYSVTDTGQINWVKVENTWGTDEGAHGYYLLSWASFKKVFQTISVENGTKLAKDQNILGTTINR